MRCKDCGTNKDVGFFSLCPGCRDKRKKRRAKTPIGLYESRCRILTQVVRQTMLDSQPTPDHVLDHRYSICSGFRFGVDIPVICQRANFQWLTKEANRIKGKNNSITLEELQQFNDVNREHQQLAALLLKMDAEQLERIGRKLYDRYKQKANGQLSI